MNAVEIEAAISDLAAAPFAADQFPFAFLAAFGNKETTIQRLRSGNSNSSDVPRGVLQRNNIHTAVCESGEVGNTLKALRASAATAKAKAKFILATDGVMVEAEELASCDTIACAYADFPNHFGFFLPLAGISTIKEIKDNPIDIRATGRLNKLYVELLRENPDWASSERRHDMNHFMARLIFCFFAEDTDIFNGEGLFTKTIEQMSERGTSSEGTNTHDVLSAIFRAMNIKVADRASAEPRLPNWADQFPYVNGGLFSGSTDVPRFTRIARSYLIQAGSLRWKEINPDIFGSMIQAVADDEERGALGMHYTSVPNILKVLNPLLLDDLRAQLHDSGDNKIKLLNLRKRIARIRVFDPACGSGNFLVIAYKQMRQIEFEINQRRGESHLGSEIPLTNFRGIELRDFPAEIARLALIIAEYQCDVKYLGPMLALAEFLPLDAQNWIVCGNALRLDWLSVCPPTGTATKLVADDLFGTPLDQAEIDFANEGGETFICGNPPYKGTKNQTPDQKSDLAYVFSHYAGSYKSCDFVCGWFLKAAEYSNRTNAKASFVSTNSICQGQHVPLLWPLIYALNQRIFFAYTSFKWANLASQNAGVTVIVVGISSQHEKKKTLYVDDFGITTARHVENINAYLSPSADVFVSKRSTPFGDLASMVLGNQPYEGGNLFLTRGELENLGLTSDQERSLIRQAVGSSEFINNEQRYCLWIEDADLPWATSILKVAHRIEQVRQWRKSSDRPATAAMAERPHQFCEMKYGVKSALIVPIRSSEVRPYLPVGALGTNCVVTNLAYAVYDAPVFNLAVIASRLHLTWIAAVCGKLETRFSYSNKMGWNTFPVPVLTEQMKADLTECAENILLAREAHFPATIADLYDPEAMPENLRHAHERNDEVLERIYIGRRFKNDTERLEKLFEMYTQMTAAADGALPKAKSGRWK